MVERGVVGERLVGNIGDKHTQWVDVEDILPAAVTL